MCSVHCSVQNKARVQFWFGLLGRAYLDLGLLQDLHVSWTICGQDFLSNYLLRIEVISNQLNKVTETSGGCKGHRN